METGLIWWIAVSDKLVNDHIIFHERKFFFFFKFTYLFWEWGGAERERIPSMFHAVSAEPDVGLELTSCEIVT